MALFLNTVRSAMADKILLSVVNPFWITCPTNIICYNGHHLLIILWTKHNNNQTVSPSGCCCYAVSSLFNLHCPIKLSAFCLCSSLVKLQPFGTKTRQNVIRNVNSTISAKVFYKCTFIKYPFIENIDNNVNRLHIRYQNIGEWAGY